MGTIYHAQGRDSAAKKAYAKALALDPALGNPEVNPHLIDNELATSAMLYAYHHYREELLPAKEFEEPARIAGVLIDRPAGEAGEGEAAAEAAERARGRIRARPRDRRARTARRSPRRLPTEKVRAAGRRSDGRASESRTLVEQGPRPVARLQPDRRWRRRSATRRRRPHHRRPDHLQQPRPHPRRPADAHCAPPCAARGQRLGAAARAVPPTTFLPTSDSTGMIEVRLVEIDEWS